MTDKPFLEPQFLLFARALAKTPPFPANNDGIKFNFALQRWELAPFGGAGEANTSSNVGAGLGWALPKVGVDLPFKSLIALAPLSIVSNPTDITISVTLDIPPSLLLQSLNTEIVSVSPDFFALSGADEESSIELNAQNCFPTPVKLKNMTISVSSNTGIESTLTMRKNGANGNQTITIPASTTGIFRDTVNTDDFGLSDLGNYQLISGGVDIIIASLACEVVKQ